MDSFIDLPGFNLFAQVFVACFGLILGSFFNVLIWRMPRGESIVKPASHCPNCSRPIRPVENIPIISFVALGGKCAGCKAPISWRYPAIEALTAIAAMVLWRVLAVPVLADANVWVLILLLIKAASLLVLVPLSLIDWDHFILPDAITLPWIVIALAAAFIPTSIPLTQSLLNCLYGILAGAGLLLVVGLIAGFLLKKEAMGLGDVKMMGFLGALWGWKVTLMGIVFGSTAGALVGVALIATKRLASDRRIPFGPYLSAGVWIAVLAGDWIVNWYFTLLDRLLHF
jgi:leader peptidase (prepilin peptidase)/N-methyltransferase